MWSLAVALVVPYYESLLRAVHGTKYQNLDNYSESTEKKITYLKATYKAYLIGPFPTPNQVVLQR